MQVSGSAAIERSRAGRAVSAQKTPPPAKERRRAFIAQLDRMSPEERLRASRFHFERWQRTLWAARYPEEVPVVNGEVEWIALRLADLD